MTEKNSLFDFESSREFAQRKALHEFHAIGYVVDTKVLKYELLPIHKKLFVFRPDTLLM